MTSSAMAPAQRGSKHVCAECACKFYDLNRKKVACPKCGGAPVEQPLPRRGWSPKKASRPPGPQR